MAMSKLQCIALLLAVCAIRCDGTVPRPKPTPLKIATFETGGIYHLLGTSLAQVYTSRVPGIHATAYTTAGSVFNVRMLNEGQFDVAFALGNVVYMAYKRGTEDRPRPYTNLRGIAVLYEGAMQIIASEKSGIRSVANFRGHRISSGEVGSGTELAARIVIDAYGLMTRDLTLSTLPTDQVVDGMRRGTIDAGFIIASYPYPAINRVDPPVGMRLLPIAPEVMRQIRAHYPFFRPTVIPAGTYRNQTEDIHTIGVDNLLICRADLDETLVYRLTKVFFEALPELVRLHPAAAQIDPERASATPIPLHAGAARYYREREILR